MDYMGRTELAANLFRITQTEEHLKNNKIYGERQASEVHRSIGNQVRQIVIANTGTKPEHLKVEKKLGDVKKELKKANKQLNKKSQD